MCYDEWKGTWKRNLNFLNFCAADSMIGTFTSSLFQLTLTLNPPNPKIMVKKTNFLKCVLRKLGLNNADEVT